MGLAATQARLLFITARQNDVSAKMQKVSNDTLILARDKTEIANNYDKMINTSTVVSTNNADTTDLSYETITGAAAIANGNGCLVTTNLDNKVVLSTGKAAELGLPAENGNKGDLKVDKNEFIKNVMGLGSVDDVDKLLGKAEKEKDETTKKSLNDLFTGFSNRGTKTEIFNASNPGALKNISGYDNNFNKFADTFDNKVSKTTTSHGATVSVIRFSSTTNVWQSDANLVNLSKEDVSFGELYSAAGTKEGMIYLGGYRDDRNDGTNTGNGPSQNARDNAINNLKTFGKGISEQLIYALVNNLGCDKDKIKNIVDTANKTILNNYSGIHWYDSFWTASGSRDDAKPGQDNNNVANNEGAIGSCMVEAYGAKGIVAMYACGDDDWQFCVNAGSYTKDLVDAVMSKITSGNYSPASTKKGELVDKNETFIIKTEYILSNENDNDNKDTKFTTAQINEAKYYSSMYDTLKNYGWITKSVDEIKSGMNNADYYVVNTKSSKSTVTETTTVDTKAADAYYEREMAKLNMKEKQLDTQLQKLQTEYSALTTDLESVKSILNANIQKSFVYCQNG